MYRPITETETTAKKATGMPADVPHSAGIVMIRASRQTPSTAATGTRFALTLDHMRQPGTARSRENAKNVREALVTQAMPQNTWPMKEIRITVSAQPSDIALVNTAGEEPPAALTDLRSTAANVIASSTNQPMMAE